MDFPSHTQLQQLVADKLRTAILEGSLKPGQWLRQRQLAEEYNVSQMPVREALKGLAAEGLVEHIPYRGVRVVEFSADDVEDLYAHRTLLEGMAARAAADHISQDELDKLKDLQRQMTERQDPCYIVEYRVLNRQFHQTIFTASHRAYLIRTLQQMWETFPTMLWSNFIYTAAKSLPERDATDVLEHDAIIQALECRDANEAERHMRRHIEAAGRDLVTVLRAQSGK
jgi:DNA-binding GntR family transcriptional regulator